MYDNQHVGLSSELLGLADKTLRLCCIKTDKDEDEYLHTSHTHFVVLAFILHGLLSCIPSVPSSY
jgi:hypothetical protein